VEATTRRQLIGALETRERQAEAEVRAAVASLHGARITVTAKAAEVRNLTAHVAELEKREAAGQQVTAELATARLDVLKLRGELLQAVTDWHIADVKLRQAMGLLVRE
jgi:outer membrane protein TolC